MVSLKWGDILSTLFPGTVAIFAISQYVPPLDYWFQNLHELAISGGVALLIASCLAGGILGAITRVSWEKFWLVKRCRPVSVLERLDTAHKLNLYERSVESSYKYVMFYANLAWAILLLLGTRLLNQEMRPCSVGCTIYLAVVVLLLVASHVQWTYFVSAQKKCLEKETVKMLNNDPPPGTEVRFVKDLREARTNDRAKLVRPLRKYWVDRPEDEFEVEFRGRRLVVHREDIE